MMRINIFFYLSVLSLSLFTFSCKNKEEEEESLNMLLTNRSEKTWILRSVLQKDKELLNEEWKEIYLTATERTQLGWKESLLTCQQDNEWTFNDNGLVVKSPGFVRCKMTEGDTTLSYFFGGPKNESLYFKEQKSQWVWISELNKDSIFTFSQIQKTDILVLNKDELRYKSVYHSPLGHYVTSSVYSFIRK